MAVARTSAATRVGSRGGVVVHGVDALVRDFTREAVTIRPRAAVVVVKHAAIAAERMRNRVAIDEGTTLESITHDTRPNMSGFSVYADAGPEWFVARFLEHGTVDTAPQPFVGPAADETVPEFVRDIKALPKL